MKSKLPLIFLLFLGLILRIYGIDWDRGFHLHPDERMLIMVAGRVHFFDRLNPDFFNYGSLPIYVLRSSSQFIDSFFSTNLANYDGMLWIGRYLSVFFDLGTVLLIYLLAIKLFNNKRTAFLSAFFYSIAFFPIQNSHFFVVDVSLTFFITLLFYLLLNYVTLPFFRDRGKMVILIGIVFAAALTTKFTAVIFYPVILLVFVYKKLINKQLTLPQLTIDLITFHFSLLTFSFIFMPYAFIESSRFISDVSAQIKMNSDPYIFPYTLQYIGTIPYFYYLKNIFLWGLGPIISGIIIVGIIFSLKFLILNFKFSTKFLISNFKFLFFIFFYLFYFLVIGRSAVKFMRYMLPVYPFLTIMAGYAVNKIFNFQFLIFNKKISTQFLNFSISLFLVSTSFMWTLMFINIYSQKHTRIAATEWILANIPKRSTIATEHWDDGLPLTGGENYQREELTLYDRPDDDKKWKILDDKLMKTDYIIIASNRLYVPLQKLADCKKYKSCYPKTAEYFKKLFAGKLGFKKVAEFAVYPTFPLISQFLNFPISINDQAADESFTVYDHPKIIIFKKNIH